MNPENLTDFNKAKILKRWRSIQKFAVRNMAYGDAGSYGGTRFESAALKADRSALALIDEILNHVLKN